MRFRSALGIVFLVLSAVFFFLNWRVFAATERLNLLITSVEAPAGLVLVIVVVLVVAALAGYAGIWHTTLLGELRRQARELEAQRTLAESAETSRLTELSTLVRAEIAALRGDLKDTEHSIAATLGEMDDRLRNRVTAESPTPTLPRPNPR